VPSEELKHLLERARRDPAFFHQLIFDPDKALSSMGFSKETPVAGSLACSYTCNYTGGNGTIFSAEFGCPQTCTHTCSWTSMSRA
jgi:hypothetical protein